jgi:hypothetical protein
MTAMTTTHKWISFVGIAVLLGIAFQIGHFFEHLFQFGMWLFSERSVAWMSPPVMAMVHWIGASMYPAAEMKRQMGVGMEVLHLIGNGIFLATIAGLYYGNFMRNRLVKWALVIEGLHLLEHVMLTLSIIYVGKPLGVSTLFGNNIAWFGQEWGVGYRVAWHFLMNLVPTILVMKAVMQYLKGRKASPTAVTAAA